MNITVDTLKLALQLESGGFTTEQARALATARGEPPTSLIWSPMPILRLRKPNWSRNLSCSNST